MSHMNLKIIQVIYQMTRKRIDTKLTKKKLATLSLDSESLK